MSTVVLMRYHFFGGSIPFDLSMYKLVNLTSILFRLHIHLLCYVYNCHRR